MIAPPRELRASLPAELRGMRRDGARLCVVERDIRPHQPHHRRSPRRPPRVRRSARRQLEPHAPCCVACRPCRWRSTLQLRPGAFARANGTRSPSRPTPPHRNVPLHAGETASRAWRPALRVVAPRAGRSAALADDGRTAATSSQTLLSDGEPIRYSYVPDPVPLEHYQTVYAGAPGSVETPSAGRHLTWELLGDLRRRGHRRDGHRAALRAQLLPGRRRRPAEAAHRGALRSPGETPRSASTERRARDRRRHQRHPHARDRGRRQRCACMPMRGWTRPRDHAAHPAPRRRRAAHRAARASRDAPRHARRACSTTALLERAYAEVRERGYLWHEFGDAMLIL